ncbi:MAG: OsmC family peroxiredoxin [Calditrichaeota bacterium]|nr:MAG: OsmC family peroxiredoxin [Calditrichota bacterium]
MQVELERIDDAFHFQALGASGVPVHIDAGESIGGRNQGARPMELVLMGLATCGAFDFMLMLKKQRQHLEKIAIRVDGDRREGTPSPFASIHLHFTLQGRLEAHKVQRALSLSFEKYCSVAEMVKSTAQITFSFEIDEGTISS